MNNIFNKVRDSQFWKSMIRHGLPDNDLDTSLMMNNNFFLHIHPVKMRKHGLKFTYTFGLGGISFLLFIILIITGALLMFYYVPSTGQAYKTMLDLKFAVPYGRVLRNIHRWAAHAMVVTVTLHMCRVFFTGGFKAPREFNWVFGVMLFVLTLLFSFTGYLLPWDQLSFWAITVASDMAKGFPFIGEDLRFILLGGNIVDQNALIRFYTLHVFVLPLVASILMFIHFWRVRKDGGISAPPQQERIEKPEGSKKSAKTYTMMTIPSKIKVITSRKKESEDTVMTFPHLIIIEVAAAIMVIVLLVLISMYVDAPLEEVADPYKSPNPAKSPWYFLGLQEIVSHTTAFWGGFFVPAFIILVLILIPYIRPNQKGIGIWFARERKVANILFATGLIIAILLIIIGEFFRGPGWAFVLPF